ncbi:helix-turn-helix transcriptional regulator [Limosilactobacillus ingluviei]|uniref:helix-turn-helix transcriptional regulator n=1 Tax=Limosilactobacillus ingluviei TaxID=148604 RepID=UPI0002DB362B|nr:helix-turn-helix transcriptional regulator [Limosilactobacillus ingluviei]
MATELKVLRVRKGLNQEEMGKQIGISQVTISAWERGDSIPSGKNIKKLADFFGVKPNVIFDAVFNNRTL